jgi:hypothetical protein
MGLQLLASRVLAPFFGNSIFVWASLITTFLAAFSTGSFVGAAASGQSVGTQSKFIIGMTAVNAGWLLLNSVASYAICDWFDLRIDNLAAKLIAVCIFLYFLPVGAFSALTPICVGSYDRARQSAGRSAGILNGISTLGNIAGVLLTALVLIPNFGIRQLLNYWWISSLLIQLSLWFVLYSSHSRQRWELARTRSLR